MPENPLDPQVDPSAESAGTANDRLTRRKAIKRSLAGAGTLAVGQVASAQISSPGPVQATSQFRIHPSIGVVRVGNADPGTYFLGPEAPGYGSNGAPATEPGVNGPATHTFKTGGLVRPQAQRFRIWEYRFIGGGWTPVQEVTTATPGVSGIEWNVHLANKKASFYRFEGPNGERYPAGALRNATVTANRQSLEINFGPRTISGNSQAPVSFSYVQNAPNQTCPLNYRNEPVIDYLGQLRTDAQGRLIVLGGKGKAGYQTQTDPGMPSYANNNGWFDDIADGPVTATVRVGAANIPVSDEGKAWVLCGPPDFAPRMRTAVSMYDLLYDLAVRRMQLPANNALYFPGQPLERLKQLKDDFQNGADYEFPTAIPDFDQEIFPLLRAAYDYYWVTTLVTFKHSYLMDPALGDPSPASLSVRQSVFGYLRAPLGINAPTGPRSMPRQNGDNPYSGQEPDAIRHATITNLQFGLMRRWADGKFVKASDGSPPGFPARPPYAITPHGLDKAALENCAGGAFFPGIEAGWQMRHPGLFIEPFRIRHGAPSQYLNPDGVPEPLVVVGPGHFSRQMAVPWHADFNDCKNEGRLAWWPAQRPDDAFPAYNARQRVDWARPTSKFGSGSKTSTHADMLDNWWKFAFVVQDRDQIVETERAPQIP